MPGLRLRQRPGQPDDPPTGRAGVEHHPLALLLEMGPVGQQRAAGHAVRQGRLQREPAVDGTVGLRMAGDAAAQASEAALAKRVPCGEDQASRGTMNTLMRPGAGPPPAFRWRGGAVRSALPSPPRPGTAFPGPGTPRRGCGRALRGATGPRGGAVPGPEGRETATASPPRRTPGSGTTYKEEEHESCNAGACPEGWDHLRRRRERAGLDGTRAGA